MTAKEKLKILMDAGEFDFVKEISKENLWKLLFLAIFVSNTGWFTQSERKKGAWIPQNYNITNGTVSTAVYYYPKCSVCGYCANYTNFCPNCGADMRGEQGCLI